MHGTCFIFIPSTLEKIDISISNSLNSSNQLFETYFCIDVYHAFFGFFIDAICCKALVIANPLIYIYHVIGKMAHNCLSVPYVTLLNIHDLNLKFLQLHVQ